MHALREWMQRLWATFRRTRRDEDLEEELRLHLEMVADEARRRGHDPKEAVRLARLEAGGSAQAMESLRDQRGLPWLEDLARDLSYGARGLKRSPGFAITALVSLALGIGANAGVFSLIDQVLLRPLRGVVAPDRLATVSWNGLMLGASWGTPPVLSYPLCRDLQVQTTLFDGIFCRHATTVNFSGGAQPDLLRAEIVSGTYFPVLGVKPALGRLIDPSDDREPGAHPVIVLSYDYWQNRFGGTPDVVGRQVLSDNYPLTVIGVAPAAFRGVDLGDIPEVWIPASMTEQAASLEPGWNRLLDPRASWLHVFGRLKTGVTAEQAAIGLRPWFAAMLNADMASARFPPTATADQRRQFLASTPAVTPAPQGRSDFRGFLGRPLLVLLGGTLLLLLLAAANVAGLLLARGAARTRELTTRMALGASRGRITRQLVAESLLLTIGGGLLGLMVAPLVTRVLRSYLGPDADISAGIDARVFLFTFAAALVTGMLCGLTPALQANRTPLNERSQISMRHGGGLRKALVIGQIALTLVLLTGAGLFVQSLRRLYDEAPDAASRVLTFRADAPSLGYDIPRARTFMREAARTLQDVPLIERVAVSNTALLTGGSFTRVLTIEGARPVVTDLTNGLRITPGFFSLLGAEMVAGRDFDERDTQPANAGSGYRSVIVNESFARRYFGERAPVGRRIGIGNRTNTPATIEIVGVVENFSFLSLRLTAREHVFFPFWDADAEDGTFFVTVRGSRDAAIAPIRAAVSQLEPALPLTIDTLDELIVDSVANDRMLATLLTGFGGIALMLSVIGLYGVMAFVAARRTQEIGLRLALGSTRRSAVWLVMRDALIMVGAGMALAVPAIWALRRLVDSQLYGVSALDEPTIVSASIGLAAVAMSAATLPAWRAAMVPPMAAIRDQPESVWHAARVQVGATVHRAIKGLTDSETPSVSAGMVTSEVAGAIHRAASFSDALGIAIDTLKARVGADFVWLVQRSGAHEYCGPNVSIPAAGVLIGRLRHYPHPLPLSASDLEAWERWARETQPEHITEIAQLSTRGVRMAVPLRTSDELVGLLLLGAPSARADYAASETRLLESVADVFALLIENARLNERSIEQEKVRRDLALAAEVQRRLLPPGPPVCDGASFAAYTLPARTVGGDYYDFLESNRLESEGGCLGIAIADVAGKGIAAALLTSAVHTSLRIIAADNRRAPSEVAAEMNRFLHQSTSSNSYATFFYAQLDLARRRLQYVNAGHNPPYLVRRSGADVEIIELRTGGTVLGMFDTTTYEDGSLDLCPGDLLIAFTDGVPEARDAKGEEFGDDRLKAFLRDAARMSVEDLSSALALRIRAWMSGAEQHDDVTFVIAGVSTAQ